MHSVMWRAELLLAAVFCVLRTSTVRPVSSRLVLTRQQRTNPQPTAKDADS
jgi:hypothetical protein